MSTMGPLTNVCLVVWWLGHAYGRGSDYKSRPVKGTGGAFSTTDDRSVWLQVIMDGREGRRCRCTMLVRQATGSLVFKRVEDLENLCVTTFTAAAALQVQAPSL